MDKQRISERTRLRFQIRALKRRERMLLFVRGKACNGNHAEAEQELTRAQRHLREAEAKLEAFL